MCLNIHYTLRLITQPNIAFRCYIKNLIKYTIPRFLIFSSLLHTRMLRIRCCQSQQETRCAWHYELLLEARTKRNMLNLFHVCKYRVRYIKIRGTSYVSNLVKDGERLLRGKLNIATFIFLQFHFLYKCNDTPKKCRCTLF